MMISLTAAFVVAALIAVMLGGLVVSIADSAGWKVLGVWVSECEYHGGGIMGAGEHA